MKKTSKEIIEYYSEKMFLSEIEFSEIRTELKSQDFGDEEISILIRRIDRNYLRKHKNAASKSLGRNMILAGILIMSGGVALTVLTYTGIFDLGNRFILAWGPILGGFVLTLMGKLKTN